MNETSVIIKFRGHQHFDYIFFQLAGTEACEKTKGSIFVVVTFCISWFEPHQSFLEGIRYL